jgi:hypothetical protein
LAPDHGGKYVDGSGCYGRNGHKDAAEDAALLARAAGRVNPDRVKNQIEGNVVQTTPL